LRSGRNLTEPYFCALLDQGEAEQAVSAIERDGEPFADVAWIREELELDELECEDLAA